MELVYLWVEKYKNIEKQGFNFSPRFTCKYEDGELTIDKKEHVSIFPDNINITAIVGENGSGKSSVMEFLLNLFDSESTHSFLLLYLYENKPRYYSYEVSPSNINKIKINGLEIEQQRGLLLNTYSKDDGHKNLISLYINNEYTNIDSRESPQFFIEDSKKSLKAINSLIIENSLKLKDISIKMENYFTPTKINIKLKKIDSFRSILDKDREFYKNDVWNKISALKSQLKDTTLSSKIDLIKKIFKIKREEYITIMDEPFISPMNVKTKQYFKWEYIDFANNIPMKITENRTTGEEYLLNISDIDEEVLNFLYELPKEFDIELEDEKRKFSKLSFGERQLLIVINNILKYLLLEKYNTFHFDSEGEEYKNEYDINEIVLFVDEFEIGLHPNWQKRFLLYFSKISKFTKKKIHLIISSHSPFLLSDLPKKNVIFLENGVQKHPLNDNEQTFGANIHTLLSHGFFMKDGIMGEFAKSKIEEIRKFYELVQKLKSRIDSKPRIKNLIKNSFERKKNRFRNIQSIIGEPFLKTIIGNYLDELEILFYGKKEFLKKEIERLQELEKSLND